MGKLLTWLNNLRFYLEGKKTYTVAIVYVAHLYLHKHPSLAQLLDSNTTQLSLLAATLRAGLSKVE